MEANSVKLEIKQEVIEIESSDSSPEDDGPLNIDAFLGQPYTRILPHNGPTTTQSYDESMEVYTYHLPETSRNTPVREVSNFDNELGFKVFIPKESPGKISKSVPWTYSSTLDELYVKMNTDCPLLVQVKGVPPLGTVIQATPYYRRPEDINNVPIRCINHSMANDETNRGHNAPEHIIRCCLPETSYTKNQESGRMSTILPYISPEMGSSTSNYVVRFMCRTSCPGGMNRRPFQVIFSLEHNGKCFGQQTIKIKVCACPGRDRFQDEQRLQQRTSGLNSYENINQEVSIRKTSKRSSPSENETRPKRVYTLTVTSLAHYNILTAMIPILEKNLGHQDSSDDDDV